MGKPLPGEVNCLKARERARDRASLKASRAKSGYGLWAPSASKGFWVWGTGPGISHEDIGGPGNRRGEGVESGSTADQASGGTGGKLPYSQRQSREEGRGKGKKRRLSEELELDFIWILYEKDPGPLITSA